VRLVCLLAGSLLAGCSGKLDPREDCVGEFVQQFELDVAWGGMDNLCDDQDLSGPTEYPHSLRTTRMEYSEGNFYLVHRLQAWDHLHNLAGRSCSMAYPVEIVIRLKSIDAKEEMITTVDGEVISNNAGGWSRRHMVVFGADHHSAPVRDEKDAAGYQQTGFGVDCAARTHGFMNYREGNGDACMVVAPIAQCHSFDHMMPIHLTGEWFDEEVTGETTELRFGKVGTLVDESTWSMEIEQTPQE
jgi:hypothetical protein